MCTTTLALTLIVNLNPFMRFDGYYILSDIWKIPNLQEHSFSLAKWWLREKLWKLNTSKPYQFGVKDERLLILYAFSTWVYRFFLFFGIALMVYHLFFKLLGVFLMGVEIVWFIIKPITNELLFWWQNRKKILLSKSSLKTFLGFFIVLLVIVVPWKTSVTMSALFRSEQTQLLFVPLVAQLESLHVKEGMVVSKGDVLATLSASPLTYEKQKSASQIKILEEQIAFWRLNEALRQHLPKLVQELMATKSQLQAYRKEESKLVLKAPFDGIIAEVEPNLRAGDWLVPQTPLIKMIQSNHHLIEAYVTEYDLNRFDIGAKASFYPSEWTYASIPLQVIAIRHESERIMKEPFLVSSLGGEIPTREDKSGLFIPQVPLYKVLLAPLSEKSLDHYPMLRGQVVVKATKAESFIKLVYQWILVTLIQESNT
jgi:putative peptide zinc metalloprotease protein